MKLQRLELYGFKSFADRVTIEFNPGITAIVGPNGCGKSNISDAIRWVLGEQRPTLVRGTRMDEVIFSGSRERKPINLAEVTLHFSNDDGTLPVDYAEVAIARRVFREADSEYLLNKQVCRLRDIQDLLMGTGVGTHAYSLIQQGMVDSILSDKTEERRYLFEEAAGVTRYKTRRRITERKLEATNQDLLRVEDIVAEVEKTVTSLKRQVGKARRFREYQAEETRLDVHLAGLDLTAFDAREAPLAEELRSLTRTETEQVARLAERDAALEALELDLISLREAEQSIRTETEGARRQIARREDSQLVTGETLKHHALRLEALSSEGELARERADDLAERRANLEVDHDAARARVARIAERISSAASAGDDEDHVAELKAERARLTIEIETLQERLGEVRQAAARQGTAAESAEERLSALESELVERRGERATAVEALDAALAEQADAETGRAEAAAALEAAREAARTAGARLDVARESLAAERAAEQAAAGRAETLAAMEARFEGYAHGVKALLAGDAPVDGLAGALTQAVEPRDPRYEAALERYLESLGHGLLARDRDSALTGADRIAAAGGGRADFLVPEFQPAGEPPELPDAAAAVVLCRGVDALRWTGDPELGRRLAPLFDRLLLVADRAAAFRCRMALAESPAAARHYVVASLEGTLVEPTGRWRAGRGAGDEGLLARRRRLGEAESERVTRGRAVTALAAAAAAVEHELRAAEAAVEAAAQRAAAAETSRAVTREARLVAEEAAAQAARRVGELERQTAEQAAARDRAHATGEAIDETWHEIEADLARSRERMTAVVAGIERHDEVRAERISARHAIELERAEAEADLRAIERELEHVTGGEKAISEGRAARAAERARVEEDSVRLEDERAATAGEIEVLHGELDTIEARLRESAEAVRELEERRGRIETELKGLRHEHDEATERRHQAALARQNVEHRRQTLRDHLHTSYTDPLETLLLTHPLAPEETGLDPVELRTRLDEVRRKRANLGPVNMLAVEEYEREAERFQFLGSQRDDLVQAKRQLEEAVRRINATARELFVETFERARENFDATFKTLFEGGHADILLADPDDPLESPIEIVASPRGKRVQSINLLSGGERALTALSLLFAIYQVKPSPFCILDEVDAPLDDANVSRFLAMIRHFSAQTQFIVITHNRRTMEAADYLYGVTMEEPGVSKLVSVSLSGGADDREETEETMEVEEVYAAAG